ncbi:MAG: ATP-binding cassette domain-containing protein [Clostridia bacterium]
MSKKAMSSKIVTAQEEGEKILHEQDEISAKEDNITTAKKLFGRIEEAPVVVKTEEPEWKKNLVVKFDKVSLKFTKEFYALFNVSFEAFEGENIAILGENECGKTSILRLIASLETPCTGTIKMFNKKPSKKLFQKEVMLGFLPENPVFLTKKTVLENMVYVKRIREKKTRTDSDVASGVLFDMGLVELKNKKISELSYFQKQCLAVARLKFRPMDAILLDGVFDKMTEEEIKLFMDLIDKVKNEKTLIVFTTIDILTAKKYSTRIIKIENGSILG